MRLTPAQLASELAKNVEAVAKHLLGPNSKHINKELCYGDLFGAAGKSLKIAMTGPHRGVWRDWASEGDRGDLLDLWAKTKGLTIAKAMRQAEDWLGVKRVDVESPPQPSFRKPDKPANLCKALSDTTAKDYLLIERKLSAQAITDYKLCYLATKQSIVFPYFTAADSSPVKYKYIKPARGEYEPRRITTSKGGPACCFGWQAIPDICRQVVITEGEIDCVSVRSFNTGHYGLSVPHGGGSCSWIDEDFKRLEVMDVIYLMLDNDETGQKQLTSIVERLGFHRCRVVDIPKPHKDANDLLKAGYTAEQFQSLLDNARTITPQGLSNISDVRLSVDSLIAGEFDAARAIDLPFSRLDGNIRLRPSELSILSGICGHGKSELAGQMALAAIDQGFRTGIASMEWTKGQCFYRLLRQIACMPQEEISKQYKDAIFDFYDKHLTLFGTTGTQKFETILELMEHQRCHFGVEFFIVDNLAKLGINEDDYNGQKDVVDRLGDFATDHDCHVMLIAHPKKMENENQRVGKMSVKGTGAIVDMCKTAISIYRDKDKEYVVRKHQKGYQLTDKEQKKLLAPDSWLKCFKQNATGWEGDFQLWFDEASHRFVEYEGHKPKPYVDFSNVIPFPKEEDQNGEEVTNNVNTGEDEKGGIHDSDSGEVEPSRQD